MMVCLPSVLAFLPSLPPVPRTEPGTLWVQDKCQLSEKNGAEGLLTSTGCLYFTLTGFQVMICFILTMQSVSFFYVCVCTCMLDGLLYVCAHVCVLVC